MRSIAKTHLFTALTLAVLATGCGRSFQGTFQGFEQIQSAVGGNAAFAQVGACQNANSPATLTMTENRGLVTGDYQSSCFTGRLQGNSNAGQLSNAVLTLTPLGQAAGQQFFNSGWNNGWSNPGWNNGGWNQGGWNNGGNNVWNNGINGALAQGGCGSYSGTLTESQGLLTGQFQSLQNVQAINPACPNSLAISFTRVGGRR